MHKKLIKRNGKVFGPYYYTSYREGGKVKTRYLGKVKTSGKRFAISAIIAAFLIIALFFFLKPSFIGFTGLTTKPLFILNPIQSYPIVGGNWTVRLNTEGTADLTIRAVGGTTWSNENNNKDLRFLEIRCDNKTLDYKWISNSVFIANYSCDKTTYHTVKVFDKGTHILEFKFGNNIKYAYNLVGCCSRNMTSMVWAANISIKYPNGSFYLQNQAMTLSSTQADTATWHNTTWTYGYTKWCGQQGNYTANAAVWEVQNATLSDADDIRVNKTNSSGWVFLYNVTWDAASGAYCTATCASNNGSWADPTPGWGATTGDSGGSSWNGMCCGDDSGEYYNTSNYDVSLTVSDDTVACCNAATDCVHAGTCNATGIHNVNVGDDAADDYCLNSVWYDCNDSSECDTGYACVSNDCVLSEVIDVTLSGIPIQFGSIDPGTTNNAAQAANGFPMNVTIETTTTVATNLTLKGIGAFASNGNSFTIGNLSYSNSSTGTKTDMTLAYPDPPPYANWIDIPDPVGEAEVRQVYFWIDIPAGQSPLTYSTTVTVKVYKN